MSEKISIETIQRLYDDVEGEYIEVGPDVDGLNMVRVHADNQYYGKFDLTLEPAVAKVLGQMLIDAAGRAIIQQSIDFPE